MRERERAQERFTLDTADLETRAIGSTARTCFPRSLFPTAYERKCASVAQPPFSNLFLQPRERLLTLSSSLLSLLSPPLRSLPDAASPATNAGLILIWLQRRAVPPPRLALALALWVAHRHRSPPLLSVARDISVLSLSLTQPSHPLCLA